MTEWELDDSDVQVDETETDDDKAWQEASNNVAKHEEAINKLIEQVANLANKLEEHMNTADAHNPAILRGGVSFGKKAL